MPDTSAQEIWDLLNAGTRTAHVATARPDGRPHVTPAWFVLDGRPGDFQLVFTTYAYQLGQLRAAASRIGGRHMGAGRAAEFGARKGCPGNCWCG